MTYDLYELENIYILECLDNYLQCLSRWRKWTIDYFGYNRSIKEVGILDSTAIRIQSEIFGFFLYAMCISFYNFVIKHSRYESTS